MTFHFHPPSKHFSFLRHSVTSSSSIPSHKDHNSTCPFHQFYSVSLSNYTHTRYSAPFDHRWFHRDQFVNIATLLIYCPFLSSHPLNRSLNRTRTETDTKSNRTSNKTWVRTSNKTTIRHRHRLLQKPSHLITPIKWEDLHPITIYLSTADVFVVVVLNP